MNIISRAILKVTSAPFAPVSYQNGWSLLPRTYRNYKQEVGDGTNSSIVVACVNWICRNFPEAPLVVKTKVGLDYEVDEEHWLPMLLEQPNPAYSGPLLWMATLFDWTVYGNAYWIKVKSRTGNVVQLWWVPASLMTPEPDPNGYILDYTYRPPGHTKVTYQNSDVVHFRNGLDPRDPRRGLSPLASLFREIFTDDEASNFSASLLTNFGVPGVIIAPQNIAGSPFQVEVDAAGIKEDYQRSFGGDKRGEPLVLTSPTDIRVLSWSPEQMNVRGLRRIPEERVTAVLGISAMVVGLGVGLDHSTYGNYDAAKAAAYENNIIPTQRLMAAEIKSQLLVDMEDDTTQFKLVFDTSNVKALSDDVAGVYNRMQTGIMGGWVTVSEARTAVGLKVDDTHDVYLRSPNVSPIPVAEGGNKVEPPAPSPGPFGAIAPAEEATKPDLVQKPTGGRPTTDIGKPIAGQPAMTTPTKKPPSKPDGKPTKKDISLEELDALIAVSIDA